MNEIGSTERRTVKMRYPDRESPFLIGVAGGTASGKSSVCDMIKLLLGKDHEHDVSVVSQESFYREFTEAEKVVARRGEFNFDHPDALDEDLLLNTLKKLKAGETVTIPSYDYTTHSKRFDDNIVIKPAKVILVEGILVFYNEHVRTLFSMKLFVDSDPDTRLARRVLRDVTDRGRTLEQTLNQYLTCVKPAYEEFCLPTKKYADIIIPRGEENEVALSLIVQHISELLKTPHSRDVPSPMLSPVVVVANGISPRNRHQSDSVYRPH